MFFSLNSGVNLLDFFNDPIVKINFTFFQKWCPDCCDEEPSFSLTKLNIFSYLINELLYHLFHSA